MKKQFISASLAVALIFSIICTPFVNADKVPDDIDNIINENINLIDTEDVSADQIEDEIFTDATVNVHMLNMRSGAGTEYSIVHVLKKGETLKVFGKYNDWYVVRHDNSGTVGCVSSYYITLRTGNTQNNVSSGNETTTLFKMINDVRKQNGLKPLILNEELSRVAEHKAMDMVENNYFDHNSPVYGSPFEMMKKYGINFNMAAENIAGNQSSEGAVYSWMNSEGHLSNILNGDYTATGIGIYTSPVYGKIYVQLFAD